MRELGLEHATLLRNEDLQNFINQLGAGFKLACYAFTRLISIIETRSLILFDEPENHTHPRLLSAMMRSLDMILTESNSFAVVATHSPIVLQEVPGHQIHVLRCIEGSYPHFVHPKDPSFGAPLGEILRQMFIIDYGERNFEVTLRRLVEDYGVERVRRDLEGGLSLSAKVLLETIESEGGEP